jgi:hypothetical protein
VGLIVVNILSALILTAAEPAEAEESPRVKCSTNSAPISNAEEVLSAAATSSNANVSFEDSPLYKNPETPLRLQIIGSLTPLKNKITTNQLPIEVHVLDTTGKILHSAAGLASLRGHGRRQENEFKPFSIEMKETDEIDNSPFAGRHKKFDITPPARFVTLNSSEPVSQDALLEYFSYRLANFLLPKSLRVKIAILEMIDTDKTSWGGGWGFIRENRAAAAKRLKSKKIAKANSFESPYAREDFELPSDWDEFDVHLFEGLIRNPDEDVRLLKNYEGIKNKSGEISFLPFDFNYTAANFTLSPYSVEEGVQEYLNNLRSITHPPRDENGKSIDIKGREFEYLQQHMKRHLNLLAEARKLLPKIPLEAKNKSDLEQVLNRHVEIIEALMSPANKVAVTKALQHPIDPRAWNKIGDFADYLASLKISDPLRYIADYVQIHGFDSEDATQVQRVLNYLNATNFRLGKEKPKDYFMDIKVSELQNTLSSAIASTEKREMERLKVALENSANDPKIQIDELFVMFERTKTPVEEAFKILTKYLKYHPLNSFSVTQLSKAEQSLQTSMTSWPEGLAKLSAYYRAKQIQKEVSAEIAKIKADKMDDLERLTADSAVGMNKFLELLSTADIPNAYLPEKFSDYLKSHPIDQGTEADAVDASKFLSDKISSWPPGIDVQAYYQTVAINNKFVDAPRQIKLRAFAKSIEQDKSAGSFAKFIEAVEDDHIPDTDYPYLLSKFFERNKIDSQSEEQLNEAKTFLSKHLERWPPGVNVPEYYRTEKIKKNVDAALTKINEQRIEIKKQELEKSLATHLNLSEMIKMLDDAAVPNSEFPGYIQKHLKSQPVEELDDTELLSAEKLLIARLEKWPQGIDVSEFYKTKKLAGLMHESSITNHARKIAPQIETLIASVESSKGSASIANFLKQMEDQHVQLTDYPAYLSKFTAIYPLTNQTEEDLKWASNKLEECSANDVFRNRSEAAEVQTIRKNILEEYVSIHQAKIRPQISKLISTLEASSTNRLSIDGFLTRLQDSGVPAGDTPQYLSSYSEKFPLLKQNEKALASAEKILIDQLSHWPDNTPSGSLDFVIAQAILSEITTAKKAKEVNRLVWLRQVVDSALQNPDEGIGSFARKLQRAETPGADLPDYISRYLKSHSLRKQSKQQLEQAAVVLTERINSWQPNVDVHQYYDVQKDLNDLKKQIKN